MKNYRTMRLMVKCSRMYYEENMNQVEIGKKLGVSKATVSRILHSAKQQGIVRINVVNPYPGENIEIEKELETLFGLQEVIVVDVESDQVDEIKNSIARETAYVLERILKAEMMIGLGNGTTLASVPNYIQNMKNNDFTFVPMVGGNGQINANIQSNNIAQSFAKAFKANYKILHAPAMVENFKTKQTFIENAGIKSVLELTESLDVAVIGIGSSNLGTTVGMLTEFVSEQELLHLRKKGAVADVCNYFIDYNGNSDMFHVNDNVIGINLESLKRVPIVIGAAGHSSKVDAIISAIRAGLIKILITDYNTASCILMKEKGKVNG